MSSEWWRKLEESYHAARELSGEARSRFLDAACMEDAAMRRQIDVLLQQDENPDSFLNTPAVRSKLDDATVKPLSSGVQVGSYRIDELIGEGGMGVVYRACDTKLN